MVSIGRKCDFLVYPVHFEVEFFCVGSLKYIHLLSSALHNGKFLIVWHVKMQSALSLYAYRRAAQKIFGLK